MVAVGKLSVLWQTALIAEDIGPPAATSPDASLSVDYTGTRSACDSVSTHPAPASAGFGGPDVGVMSCDVRQAQSDGRAWQDPQALHPADLSRKRECPLRMIRMTLCLCHAGYTGHIAASPTGSAVAVITPARDVAHIYTLAGGAWLRAGTFDPKAASGTGGPRYGADVAETRHTAKNTQRSSPPVGPLLLSAWAADALTLAVAADSGQIFLINRHVTEYAVSGGGA